MKINKRKKEIKLNEKKKKKILTFLFQKQDLGYCCQPFPCFPLSIELIQSLQLVGWWEGSWIWLWDGAKALLHIYIYGGLSWKLGATSKRRAMGVKERPTRRSGTKRDVSERLWIEGFFHRTLTKTAMKSSPTSSVFVLYETNWKKTSQKDTNWEAIIILIQNQTWVEAIKL